VSPLRRLGSEHSHHPTASAVTMVTTMFPALFLKMTEELGNQHILHT
jgi:hypothetical protein